MKKLSLFSVMIVALLATSWCVTAQIVLPDLSPAASVIQKIGFSDVRIDYGRPSVRGRIVFGELVPYDEVWRLGANASTKIIFWEELTIQDQYKLQPGIYSMYAIPGKEEWTIVFNKNIMLWGAFNYLELEDALRFRVKTQRLKEQVETFTIQFSNVCSTCAEVQLLWDFTRVSFRISTKADEKVVSQIKAFTSNPESKIAGEYYLAAKYYLDSSRDLNKALEWIDKSLQYAPEAYWVLHTKAEIQAKMGDYKAAIETATISRNQAKEKNDKDYVRMNELEIEKWKAIRKSGTN